uniref:Regulatory protein zeste n=1 Tax=Globodera rostochiensis TaxID=31243 RepID=A0A914I2K5_GLORO
MTNRSADNVVFVQCILPHREYLFSKFSPKITHEGKKRRWLYIRDQLVASGMAHFVGKDDSYMRQKWADMKRRTIEKWMR